MNSTNEDQINEPFLISGSYLPIDSIYLFFISPLSFIGLILNMLSFYVIVKINIKNIMIYKYLKVYCINSGVICLISSLSFYVYSPRLVGIYLDLFARVLKVIKFYYIIFIYFIIYNWFVHLF